MGGNCHGVPGRSASCPWSDQCITKQWIHLVSCGCWSPYSWHNMTVPCGRKQRTSADNSIHTTSYALSKRPTIRQVVGDPLQDSTVLQRVLQDGFLDSSKDKSRMEGVNGCWNRKRRQKQLGSARICSSVSFVRNGRVSSTSSLYFHSYSSEFLLRHNTRTGSKGRWDGQITETKKSTKST